MQTRKSEINLLPGVAIGVSLVPPLSAAGMLIYFGAFDSAFEAGLLFLTNLAAIILSACGVFFLLGVRPAGLEKGSQMLGTDFTVQDLYAAIRDFARRTRRFGSVVEA